jgi:lipopolysaccharide export system permease protein
MRILNRYLFNSIAGPTALVLLVLLSLSGFVSFIAELHDVGEGDYTLYLAAKYALLKLPRLASSLMPVSVLLGSLLGLGALASSSELIVMRSAGVSIYRLAKSVALAGFVLAIVGGVISEFMAPQLDLYARQMKAIAKSKSVDITDSNAWLRNGDLIFNIRPSLDGREFGGVYTFRFGSSGSLTGIGRGDTAEEESGWSISNYQESQMGAGGVKIATEFDDEKLVYLKDLLSITAVRQSSLTAAELWSYVQYLKSNGLKSDRYEIAFWNRVSAVFGILIMAMLALPFATGSLRSAGMGARMVIGALIGLGYFLLTQTLADSVAVFSLSPILVAWFPTVLLFMVVWIGLNRAR